MLLLLVGVGLFPSSSFVNRVEAEDAALGGLLAVLVRKARGNLTRPWGEELWCVVTRRGWDVEWVNERKAVSSNSVQFSSSISPQ